MVRAIAGRILDFPSSEVVIDRRSPTRSDEGGPPRVTGASWLSVSVTHSAGRVGVAVASGAKVGLDVEFLGPAPEASLVGRVCSVDERVFLADVPSAHVAGEFTRLWCRKESALKAYGVGLVVPPAAIDVSGTRPAVDGGDSRGFHVGSTAAWLPSSEAGSGFVAALFATASAELVAEVSVDEISSLSSPVKYREAFNAFNAFARRQ